MKKVVFVSTVAGIIPGMKEAFARQFPDVQLINLLDDGIIPEIPVVSFLSHLKGAPVLSRSSHTGEMSRR